MVGCRHDFKRSESNEGKIKPASIYGPQGKDAEEYETSPNLFTRNLFGEALRIASPRHSSRSETTSWKLARFFLGRLQENHSWKRASTICWANCRWHIFRSGLYFKTSRKSNQFILTPFGNIFGMSSSYNRGMLLLLRVWKQSLCMIIRYQKGVRWIELMSVPRYLNLQL